MAEYINKAKLREAMYHESFEKDSELQRWDNGCWIRYKLFENVIDSVPAADVQPVVHGKWETEICDDGYGAYNLFVCSLCGSESAKRFNYCRECGARMDGET